MEVNEHIEKACQITSSLQKCSLEDYEALVEGAMLATTHWFNAVLHVKDIRPLHLDVMHSTKLSVEEHIRCEVLFGPLLEALELIEDLRSPFVRGIEPGGEDAGQLAMNRLNFIEGISRGIIEQSF